MTIMSDSTKSERGIKRKSPTSGLAVRWWSCCVSRRRLSGALKTMWSGSALRCALEFFAMSPYELILDFHDEAFDPAFADSIKSERA